MNVTATTSASANVIRRNAVTDEPLQRPGKSADAVGYQAKMKIAAATFDEAAPSNIQGKVASALVRDLPLDTILVLQQPADAQEPVPPENDAEEPAAVVDEIYAPVVDTENVPDVIPDEQQ